MLLAVVPKFNVQTSKQHTIYANIPNNKILTSVQHHVNERYLYMHPEHCPAGCGSLQLILLMAVQKHTSSSMSRQGGSCWRCRWRWSLKHELRCWTEKAQWSGYDQMRSSYLWHARRIGQRQQGWTRHSVSRSQGPEPLLGRHCWISGIHLCSQLA